MENVLGSLKSPQNMLVVKWVSDHNIFIIFPFTHDIINGPYSLGTYGLNGHRLIYLSTFQYWLSFSALCHDYYASIIIIFQAFVLIHTIKITLLLCLSPCYLNNLSICMKIWIGVNVQQSWLLGMLLVKVWWMILIFKYVQILF